MLHDIFKLEIFIPQSHFEQLRTALASVDAGHIGNYDQCLSWYPVQSCWRPLEGTHPYNGTQGKLCQAEEYKVEVCCYKSKLEQTLYAIKSMHPYEEPVINIIPLWKTHRDTKPKLTILQQDFSICKLIDFSNITLDIPFTFISKTDEEFSLVCPTDCVPNTYKEKQDGWKCFKIVGVLDFSLTGILSGITTILAEQKISIFAVSTYNTDYILVKEFQLNRTIDSLKNSGYIFE